MTGKRLRRGQIDKARFMAESGEQGAEHIGHGDFQRGAVETGMTTQKFLPRQIPVDKEAYPFLPVVHKPQHADRTGSETQQGFHAVRISEAQAGRADLLGEDGGTEGLVPGHEQEIVLGLLTVGEKQIFAYRRTEHLLDLDGFAELPMTGVRLENVRLESARKEAFIVNNVMDIGMKNVSCGNAEPVAARKIPDWIVTGSANMENAKPKELKESDK